MGPLSAKQHREYLKHEADENRKSSAFVKEQERKEQLHQLKLKEAGAKASQGIAHKEENHAMKLAEGTMKVPRINRNKLGLPSMNPLSGAEVLGQGQKHLPGMVPKGTDTVPAMLTPGEAVIPAPAAQNPKNKKTIKKMVQEGRKANRTGVLGFADGTMEVPQLEVQPLTIQDPRMGYTAPMYNGKYIENIPTRSNNPGNLMYAGQPGAIPGVPRANGGSFALFANPELGVNALERQVAKNTQERGQSIKQMMAKYAPKSENNTNKYVKNLSKDLGISPTAKVPMSKVPALSRAISKHEGYKGEYYSDGTTGVKYYEDGVLGVPFDATTQEIPIETPQLSLGAPLADPRLITNAVPVNTAVPVAVETSNYDPVDGILKREGSDLVLDDAGAGPTKYGINYRANAEALKKYGITDPTKMGDLTEAQAREVYKQKYVTPFDSLRSNEKAFIAVTDTGVNMGIGTAKKMWEQSGNDLDKFNELRRQRYIDIAKNDPSKAQFLKGWLKRVDETSGKSGEVPMLPQQSLGVPAPDPRLITNANPVNTAVPVAVTPLTPAETEELATLRKVVTSNIYPANEVGKARMRISELEKKVTGVPKPEATPQQKQWADEWRGTVKPDIAQRVAEIDASVPPKPEVPAVQTTEVTPTTPAAPVDTTKLNTDVANAAKEVAPQIQNAVKEAESIADPVAKKTFLERFISNTFGEKGLFSERDLARFAVVAAGGLLTGGSVGGSLRFAAKDTLMNVDKRNAVEVQQEFEREKVKAANERAERSKLIDQGYEPANIDKYFKTRTVTDLGNPRTTYSFKETGEQYTVDRGPQSGMVFQIVDATTKTGKGTGDTIKMVVDPRSGNKIPLSTFQANSQKLGYNAIPYSAAAHSPTARANRVKDWVEKDANTIANQAIEQVYGASNVKGAANTARANVPTSAAIGAQSASFFKATGFEPGDSNEMLEATNIMNVAVNDMIADQQTRKVKVSDITPYLSRSMITVRSGIDPDLFKIGAGDKAKLMPPEKITQLNYLVKEASSKLSGGQTNEAAEKALYQNMALAWKSNPKLRESYLKPGPEESSFYMFMKDKLSAGLKEEPKK